MQLKKVILVFKTHFDIGFTRLSSEILEYYKGEMLDRVAETCNATKDLGNLRYVWTMPSWPLKTMLDGSEESHAAMLSDLIDRGQVTWHALPFTSHYDFSGIGEAIWGLDYAKTLSERYHVPLKRAAKMTDVPGYGRFLPELLADAGIRFLHLGCNDFAMPPKVPGIFWWEAPSGKRVLTMYNSGYGTPALPPEDWPFSTWMALMNTNDNSGPQSADIVQSMYARIHAQHPEAEIVCGTLEEVWDALSAEDLSQLPVVRLDLADTWIHGAASYPREVATVRRLRGRLNRVSRALAARNGQPNPEMTADLARAYDALALFAEHTWGLDVKTWLGTIPDYDDFDRYRSDPRCLKMEESWREQSERVEAAEAACAHAERALGLLPPQRPVEPSAECLSGECSLSGDRYRIDFSADTGVIHGLYDLQRNCCLLKERDGDGVFAYRYERYGADEMTEYLRAYARRFSYWGILDNGRDSYPECNHVTRRPVLQRCERSGRTVRFFYAACAGELFGDAEQVVLSVTIPEGDAPVRVRLDLKGKHATPYVESASLCMPLAADAPRYFVNKTGSVLRPETDIADNANHAFYALEHFIAAEDSHALVAAVSHDCPLVSIGENGVYAFREQYEAHTPEFRFCLFNNMWGTNFPQWIEGDMAFEFDVFAEAPAAIGRVYSAASRLAENPDCAPMPDLPVSLSDGLRLAGLRVEAEAMTLHVQSCENARIPARIEAQGWCLQEVDLLGRTLAPVQANAVDTDFAPYDLRTFRLTRETA